VDLQITPTASFRHSQDQSRILTNMPGVSSILKLDSIRVVPDIMIQRSVASSAKIRLGLRSGDGNFYRYVRNGPVNLVDPLGLKVTILIGDRAYSPSGNIIAGTIIPATKYPIRSLVSQWRMLMPVITETNLQSQRGHTVLL
jgi:hypothetical protein